MKVLISGNLLAVTNKFCEKIARDNKLIICGKPLVSEYLDRKIITYPYQRGEKEYEGIFSTYDFDMVIFFSKVLDGKKNTQNELKSLENILYLCKKNCICHIIYVTTNDYVLEKGENKSSRDIILHSCELLCEQFVSNSDASLTLVRIPYIYSKESMNNQLGKWIQNAEEQKRTVFTGNKNAVTDFILDQDLGELIYRIMDEQRAGYVKINAFGGNEVSFGEIATQFTKCKKDITVDFLNYSDAIPACINEKKARVEYGWYPISNLEEDLPAIMNKYEKEEKTKLKKKLAKTKEHSIRRNLLILSEIVIFYFLSERLEHWLDKDSLLKLLDFRFFFVLIIGTVHGLYAGVFASILSCIGYFIDKNLLQSWQIVFYNIENWIPFALYLLTGSICGYQRDKKEEEIHSCQDQQEVMEKKYIFLNELYSKALKNKEEYKSQILSYEDSFGKLYHIVQRLNATIPEKIMYEAILAIEELLQVHSAAIYTIESNSIYARLSVCSKEITSSMKKSMKLDNYPEINELIKKGENWINKDSISDYPDYVCPFFRDNIPVGLVVIENADFEQMNMNFVNKLNIITGLIKDSLIRAMEYEERELKNSMIPETCIMKREYFVKKLEIRKQMERDELSQYMLKKIIAQESNLKKLGDMITACIRKSDIIGQGKDGSLYLMLPQSDHKGNDFISERVRKFGITLEACSSEEI